MLIVVFYHNKGENVKIIAVIPAHLASVRLSEKMMLPIHGLPMLEHVRRRALLSNKIDDVYVATCDDRIANMVKSYGGNVIMTANTHTNGTSRVAEAIKSLDCTHVILLQGDEPLLDPSYIDHVATNITSMPERLAWNITGPIEQDDELDRHSFVKCAVARNGRILFCFRRSPSHQEIDSQKKYIRKILGVIAYKKEFLSTLISLQPGEIEAGEFIEQMRIIEYGYDIFSIDVKKSLPSVNEPHEIAAVMEYLQRDKEQMALLQKILVSEEKVTTL